MKSILTCTAGRTGRMGAKGYVVTLGDDHDFRDLKKLLTGEVELSRVYFAGYNLTTKRPKKKVKKNTQEMSANQTISKKKKKNIENVRTKIRVITHIT